MDHYGVSEEPVGRRNKHLLESSALLSPSHQGKEALPRKNSPKGVRGGKTRTDNLSLLERREGSFKARGGKLEARGKKFRRESIITQKKTARG